MCLINVYFHFVLNALCAHGCHLETLSICVFQHFEFCILMYYLFSKNTSSVVSICLFPQNFPTIAFPVLHQSYPHFISLTSKLPAPLHVGIWVDDCNIGRGNRIINLGFGGQFCGAEATGATALCCRNKQVRVVCCSSK